MGEDRTANQRSAFSLLSLELCLSKRCHANAYCEELVASQVRFFITSGGYIDFDDGDVGDKMSW